MMKFNIPTITGGEMARIAEVFDSGKFSGSHGFNRACNAWLKGCFGAHAAMVVPSCTHALEMAAILADIREGDEVIMPSFAFTSTANAFVLRGARPVFIDVRPDTMNMDEGLVARAITGRTKAVAALHYAGVPCEMDVINGVAKDNGLVVVEDAAQAIMSRYRGRYCGTLGEFGCFSFHETKNIQCGEGGALMVNDPRYVERAEIIREKGTDRERFFRGDVDKYTWVDIGSSFLLNEVGAAFLYAQLENAEEIIDRRLRAWGRYLEALTPLREAGIVELPSVPDGCEHNGHIFYMKVRDLEERGRLITHMKARGISCVFHYIPLHSSPAGLRFGRFHGEDRWTTSGSGRLIRLPLYHGITGEDINTVVKELYRFYGMEWSGQDSG